MKAVQTTGKKELLFICGMHRSGTSLIAKSAELLGFGLGESLMPPSEDNPKGFFEDLDIVAVNDRLLLVNQSSWDAPTFRSNDKLIWNEELFTQGCNLLSSKLDTQPQLAIKDPRLCLTLPFWCSVARSLEVGTSTCFVSRNPLAISG